MNNPSAPADKLIAAENGIGMLAEEEPFSSAVPTKS
jgi:hypothetical protein